MEGDNRVILSQAQIRNLKATQIGTEYCYRINGGLQSGTLTNVRDTDSIDNLPLPNPMTWGIEFNYTEVGTADNIQDLYLHTDIYTD